LLALHFVKVLLKLFYLYFTDWAICSYMYLCHQAI